MDNHSENFVTKVSFKKESKKDKKFKEGTPFLIIRDDAKDKIFNFGNQSDVIIGRQEDADIPLDDEQVSRSHARIFFKDSHIVLEDQDSTNGTIVNGTAITKKILEDGDEIIIGSTVMEFFVPTSMGDKSLGITIRTHNYFESRLDEELDRANRYERPLSLMMIGINFKALQKTETKETLDEKKEMIIAELVLMIKGMIRAMDIISAYSSEELELMLPETSKDEAYKLARRITSDAVKSIGIPVNIGIANYPDDSLSKELLIDKSRQALKLSRAKRTDSIADVTKENVKRINVFDREVVIQSDKVKEIFDMISRVALSNINVLILGETGVGKEVVAEAVHQKSARKNKPLISVNCAALTETILESELFGHEKGSFTGADKLKIGLFESAKGGTIFLDEIGEMPMKTQAKLLRVLQNKKIMRVGSSQEIAVDVRIIAASNKNLEEHIDKGLFREDLFYRLNAITITVPPLRERKEEIPPLIQSFTKLFNTENNKTIENISPDAMELLCKYDWPGNIRELKNSIERAVVVADSDTIFKEHFSAKIFKAPQPKRPLEEEVEKEYYDDIDKETAMGDMKEIVSKYEKKLILNALRKCNWNQTKAADILNVPRRTLVSKIKKYNVSKYMKD
ncbi:MAG: sigma 54-interacting transcriptional regulator [Pseudomonadota bacterium]